MYRNLGKFWKFFGRPGKINNGFGLYDESYGVPPLPRGAGPGCHVPSWRGPPGGYPRSFSTMIPNFTLVFHERSKNLSKFSNSSKKFSKCQICKHLEILLAQYLSCANLLSREKFVLENFFLYKLFSRKIFSGNFLTKVFSWCKVFPSRFGELWWKGPGC